MQTLLHWMVMGAVTAASAWDFEAAVRDAVAPVEVMLGGTTVGAPIVTRDNQLDALLDGTPQVIEAATQLIARAEHTLLLQIYEWEDNDESTQHVSRAIEARVARALGEASPLQVRLLVDNSWPALSAKHRDKIEAYVAHLASQPLAARQIYVELAYFPGRGVGILHSKSIVRDGVQALVMTGNFRTAGGMASDYYNMAAQVSGPVARVLQQDWLHARHDSVVKAASGLATMEDDVDKDPWRGDLPGLTAAVLSRRANPHLRNQGDVNPQDRALLALIGVAREHITVLNPAINIGVVMDALVDAIVTRQVRVDMVLSLNMDRRNQAIFGGADNAEAAYRMYKRILRQAGPGVADRLTIRWASLDARAAAPDGTPGNVHAKAASYDDNALWVGSMNWDWQSWNNSRELSVLFFGTGVADDFNARIFAHRFALAAPMRAEDLPRVHRRRGNAVYAYLQARAPKGA